MASAACSSTCIPRRELLGCSQVHHRSKIQLKPPDVVACGALRAHHLVLRKTGWRLFVIKEKELSCLWRQNIRVLGKSYFRRCSHELQHTTPVRAVATVEPNLSVESENVHRYGSNWHSHPSSDFQNFQCSNDGSVELDEREKLRRKKISKANKGNVPWNKGRKHSEETLRKIRERTRIAMQDPKVKLKLANLGHAQSEETRMKIGAGVREGWQRRREKLVVQETCLFEWQNLIAETSRKGYVGQDELQWDSYEILDEKLQQEWLESIELRKTMPRTKGSKRAPKSAEQRRKIAAAISAKWKDPGYRERVCAALIKYHGTSAGQKKPRRKPSDVSEKKVLVRKKPTKPKEINCNIKIVNKASSKRRPGTPSYKDPMAISKLEMIKKIREQRAAMETKKREAIERAKLLIAEAEKAAKALEVAASKSPLAHASLLETRKLIAEATRSIQSLESRQLTSRGKVEDEFIYSGRLGKFQTSTGNSNIRTYPNELAVNGTHLTTSSKSQQNSFNLDKFADQDDLQDSEPSLSVGKAEDSSEVVAHYASPFPPANNVRVQLGTPALQVDRVKVNGSITYKNLSPESEEEATSNLETGENSNMSATKAKKKWICGKLVEVAED